MTKEEVKVVLKKIWDQRLIIAGAMLFTGILDLIGLTSKWEIGLGFILGLLAFIAMGIAKIVKK